GYYGGVTGFLVEKGTPGFYASQKFEKMGLRTSPLGELVFEDVFVRSDAILGGAGGGSTVFTHAMDWERSCLVASHLGAMDRLLETSVRYASSRKQFGQAIGKFEAVSHKIANIKV